MYTSEAIAAAHAEVDRLALVGLEPEHAARVRFAIHLLTEPVPVVDASPANTTYARDLERVVFAHPLDFEPAPFYAATGSFLCATGEPFTAGRHSEFMAHLIAHT